MKIFDRSALELLLNECIAENTSLEVMVFGEYQGAWKKIPISENLIKNILYKVVIKLLHIGTEVLLEEVVMKILKTPSTMPVKFYYNTGESPVPSCEFNDIGTLSDGQNAQKTIYIKPDRVIIPEERNQLFSVSIYSNIKPRGHFKYNSAQGDTKIPALSAPNNIIFNNIVVGKNTSELLELANNGDKTLTINNLRFIKGNDYQLNSPPASPFDIHSNKVKAIEIKFSPTKTGKIEDNLIIESTDPANPVYNIGVSGNGLFAFHAVPNYLDFGNVVENNQIVKSISLCNESNNEIVVSKTEISNALSPFSFIEPTPFNIPPNKSINLNIQFKPRKTITYSDEAKVMSSYVAQPELIISLKGTGISEFEVTPISIEFGKVTINTTTAAKRLNGKNNHNGSIQITDINIQGENPGSFVCIESNLDDLVIEKYSTKLLGLIHARPKSKGAHNAQVIIDYKHEDGIKILSKVVSLHCIGV